MSVPERQTIEADIVCVGFGPATGGFLTTLSRGLDNRPLQVLCYERADDVGFGVSGVVTRARAIRASFPDFDPEQVPLSAPVREEKLLYLLDPHGAGRRPVSFQLADKAIALARPRDHALELPWVPGFLHKRGGLVLGIGQFNQWVSQQIMMTGAAQIWPGTPVGEPLIEDGRVAGVRLADQDAMPGMDVRARLTVVSDGPVGPVSRRLDQAFRPAEPPRRDEWAVGMKMVVELPPGSALEPGTVYHTIGYPEPEIFGFLYVHPGGVASIGIFVPSWFRDLACTSYQYLQHYVRHPFFWRLLAGGRLRSWGAKTLLECGRRGEPLLAGDGYARIGESSGSTNVLTGSGVDEAWFTGVLLAEAVLELLAAGGDFSRRNLEETYVGRRRASWLEAEARTAERARDGFHRGPMAGFLGMALAGLSGGRLAVSRGSGQARRCTAAGRPEWPQVEYDGQLLMSHQDALLVGGKVQAPPGWSDHVSFLDAQVCATCGSHRCIDMCSGQAIHAGEAATAAPVFDREKCVHCGACQWNCELGNIRFQAAAGGLHSGEN